MKHQTTLKPFDQLTNKAKQNRVKGIAKEIYTNFKQISTELSHTEDNPILKSIEIDIKDTVYQIQFGKENIDQNRLRAQAAVQSCDSSQITRKAYRSIASLSLDLPREWLVAAEKQNIIEEMEQIIPIHIVNLASDHFNEQYNQEIHISDSEIVRNVHESIGKAAYRSVSQILKYLIPNLTSKNVLNCSSPEIHIRISGDGRNIGRKVKQVMLTFSILNDIENIQKPDHHFTIILYPGIEKYETLSVVLAPLLEELKQLNENGIEDELGTKWRIIMYFSSDWKFLAINLGMNSANSKYFCPWCEVSKEQIGDLDLQWRISKSMEQIKTDFKTYNGHIKPALFDMIPLYNWIPDELHIMLRITDVLWMLVLSEIRARGNWSDRAMNIIVAEMKRINVKFCFWKEQGSTAWQYTSLMGKDKLKVLESFDLSKLFPISRALQIRNLWNKFLEIYFALQKQMADIDQFANDVKNWLQQFSSCGNGFYQKSDITPYMHVLAYHIPELMRIHQRWSIKSFSCSPVELKNHTHTSHFFKRTCKDGGVNRKSAIIEILEYENRILYFCCNNNLCNHTHQPKKLRIE